jgi:hypothetical protein
MDIAGARALKERLGEHGRDDAPVASVDVPEDAPPVYHYLGVGETPLESAMPEEEASPPRRRSRWSRLRPRRN